MKAGFIDNVPLRKRIETRTARHITEALVQHAQDLRQTQAAWDAGTKTNVTSFADGRLTLTPSNASAIQQTSGTDSITDLDDTSPWTYIGVSFGGSLYGANPRLRQVELYIDIQPNTGIAPFDGEFILRCCRIARLSYSLVELKDYVGLQEVAASVRVKASELTSLAGYVAFAFPQSPYAWGPQAPVLDRSWVPSVTAIPTFLGSGEVRGGPTSFFYSTDRTAVFILQAVSASGSTNYALKKDNGVANPYTSGGNTIRYATIATASFLAPRSGRYGGLVTAGTGCPRMKVATDTYPATGSLELLTSGGDGFDLGASPTGTVEFRVVADVPPGCTGQAYVRVPTGPGPWIAVNDGQAPADIGIASQQTYDMKYEMASDSTLTATPALWQLGVVDVTTKDLTEIAGISEYEESVDVLTGRVKMAEATLTLELTGCRDYRDVVTTLFSTYYPSSQIQIRTFVGGPNLTRAQYGHLETWDVDEVAPGASRVELTLVSVLNRLEGRFPRASGTRTGYLLKTAASDLTGGADFTKELSETTETAGTIAFSVAASSTEVQYAYTPATVPGLIRWADGTWTVKVEVTVGNSNIYLGVRLVRTNASGTLQERRPDRSTIASAEEQVCSVGVKTFTFNDIGWSEGASTGRDRLRVEYYFRNAAGTSQSVTIATGTANTEVIPPWVQTTSISPVVFDDVYPGSAFSTWRDSYIGLPARFRGSVPDTNRWRIAKAVLDADGRRELERLAWLDGAMVIGSQGVVKTTNLWGPRTRTIAVLSAENANVHVSQGFSDRLPEYACAFGYDSVYPRAFAGEVKAQHAAAYAALGPSRLGPKDPRVEDETARYVTTAAHAGEIARGVVLSMGAGFVQGEAEPTDWLPHVELGDDLAFESDEWMLKDPSNGLPIRGWTWAIGTVIRTRGWRRSGLSLWVRGLVDVVAINATVQRRLPYEGPLVGAVITPIPGNLANARVKAKCTSSTATIYYHVHEVGTDAPSRDRLEQWTAYSTELTILRNASDDRLISFFARDGGFTGPIATYRIAPDATAQVTNLSATQSGASPNITVTFTATVDADTRRVRFYWRKDSAGTAWPTVDGTQGAAVSETYFLKEVGVDTAAGGFYSDGTAVAGGALTATGQSTAAGSADLCASTNFVQVIAVAVDYNKNVGTRGETSYDVQGSAGASVAMGTPSVNTAGTSCAALRKYDFTWTPTNVVDGTHDLFIYATLEGIRELIHTEVSPNSVTSATAVAISGYAGGVGDPTLSIRFDYELKAGSTVVNSGSFGAGLDFAGQTCF